MSSGADLSIKLWKLESDGAKELQTYRGHRDWVTSAMFSKDGYYVVSASVDRTLKIWEITSKDLPFLPEHTGAVDILHLQTGALLKIAGVRIGVGAPPVLALATGYGATGASVIDVADYVHFTGSTATGRKVGVACAEQLKPFSLELGGKDPAIVLADADVERAANGIAWGGMFNSGQVCVSVERVYVEAPVYDEFVARLTENVSKLQQGSESGPGLTFDVGAMATGAQRDIVARHVEQATEAGARVLAGGKPVGRGTFFQPTVLADVTPEMTCIAEETFGPTLPVVKVADEDEAVRLANDSKYGLSATVWTGDTARGERVARRLECGAVNVNDALTNVFCPGLPMGGWKESGIGYRAGGAAGLIKFCRQQAITAPRIPTQKSELLWYSSSKRQAKLALAAMRAVAGHGLRRFGIGRG